jgi:hypothetical protein
VTVGELRKKLEGLDPKAHVVVYTEAEAGKHMYEVSDVSMSKGTPRRHENGKAGFSFDQASAIEWLFISIEEA